MEEKHGNVDKMFDPINEGYKMPDIHFYLNWQCTKCTGKYGTQPYYCHGCGCKHFIQIEPEYQSLMR